MFNFYLLLNSLKSFNQITKLLTFSNNIYFMLLVIKFEIKDYFSKIKRSLWRVKVILIILLH